MVFQNNFSWSKSRDSLFKECQRKYYFNHYGFWNGWDSQADEIAKKIYYLKKLKTKEIWVGQLVHEVIEYILKKHKIGEKISLSHGMAILKRKLEGEYRESLVKKFTQYTSKLNKLFEHEYNLEITEEEKQKIFEEAGKCLLNFYNSDSFMEIRNTPVENWILLEDFLSFDFEGDTIFLSIDFAMEKDGKFILYDWKTGKERTADFDLQMMLYSFYVKEKFGIKEKNIIARIFNVSIDKVDDFVVDSEKLDLAKNYMRESIREMKEKLSSVSDNSAQEENFPRVHEDQELKYPCARCNFRKICKGEWKKS